MVMTVKKWYNKLGFRTPQRSCRQIAEQYWQRHLAPPLTKTNGPIDLIHVWATRQIVDMHQKYPAEQRNMLYHRKWSPTAHMGRNQLLTIPQYYEGGEI